MYPAFDYKIKEEKNKPFIFDEARKQWVVLTPEEWVRQNTFQYLIQTMQYPASLIAVEKELHLGELKKRFDVLVYDAQHKPCLMIECKAIDVVLNEKVLQQVLRYNITIPVPYLCITNGNEVYLYQKLARSLKEMDAFPAIIF